MPGILNSSLPETRKERYSSLEKEWRKEEAITDVAVKYTQPVKLDSYLEILAILGLVDILYIGNIEFFTPKEENANRMVGLFPLTLPAQTTVTVRIGEATSAMFTVSMDLQRVKLDAFAGSKKFQYNYIANNIAFGNEFQNPLLILPGQEMIFTFVTKVYYESLVPSFNYIKRLEGEKEVEEYFYFEEPYNVEMSFLLQNTNNVVAREVSTLPDRADETAAPRRVI